MQPNDVSIIIPAYCTDAQSLVWLKECIDSAVNQCGEVVVYDDGSPVDIRPTTGKYTIVVGFGDHHGVSHARNEAIKLASKPLILPLDCDDYLKPDAVSTLLKYWDGTPTYPDVAKVGDENVPHYILLDFACEHILNHVGFSSVNVLHTKAQWQAVGGYDEQLEFYEDGEYNARLFSQYCGKRCPYPLACYRMHAGQRTKLYERKSAKYSKIIKEKARKLDMACSSCGKRRSSTNTDLIRGAIQSPEQLPAIPQDVNALPLTNSQGWVLVQYVGGKGRGKHYYQGTSTKEMHKVTYGQVIYVDPRDVDSSYFVAVVRPGSKAVAPVKEAAFAPSVSTEEVIRVPIAPVVRKAVVAKDLPDITNMSTNQVFGLDVTTASATQLLKIELAGKNRTNIVKWLRNKLK